MFVRACGDKHFYRALVGGRSGVVALTALMWLLERKTKLSPQQADVIFRRPMINGLGSPIKMPG
jgi:hypothetical protein